MLGVYPTLRELVSSQEEACRLQKEATAVESCLIETEAKGSPQQLAVSDSILRCMVSCGFEPIVEIPAE
jgi:hypothetical protein